MGGTLPPFPPASGLGMPGFMDPPNPVSGLGMPGYILRGSLGGGDLVVTITFFY